MTVQNAAAALLIILPLAFNLFFFLLGRHIDYPNILRSPTGAFRRPCCETTLPEAAGTVVSTSVLRNVPSRVKLGRAGLG